MAIVDRLSIALDIVTALALSALFWLAGPLIYIAWWNAPIRC
jgi:hypothetical protein